MKALDGTERNVISAPARPEAAGVADIAEEYLRNLAELARRIDVRAAAEVAQAIVDTVVGGHTVFVAGNGGSASTATHLVCDLLGTCMATGLRHARVIGLADNASVLTALANDAHFDEIFSRQLALQGRPGDLLLLLSVSGESPNLLAAARTARSGGLRVAAGVGVARSSLVEYCDVWVGCGSADYGLTEDLHLALNHIVARVLNGGRARTCRPD